MHVDEFIDDPFAYGPGEQYARWVLNHFRLSATLRNDFDQFMEDKKLFCKYQDRTYRVIGASRMGDIWLCKDFDATHGYDHRVDVVDCSEWSDNSGDAVSEPKEEDKEGLNETGFFRKTPTSHTYLRASMPLSFGRPPKKKKKRKSTKALGGLEY